MSSHPHISLPGRPSLNMSGFWFKTIPMRFIDDQGCGMGADAMLYLTERGVQVVGTNAWSWDAPFSHTARRWAETRDPVIIWEGHKAGRIRPYYQIEKLTNLDAVPATGFTFCCFPVKIERASAGWIRAVAMVEG